MKNNFYIDDPVKTVELNLKEKFLDNTYQACNKCVMDSSIPGIYFFKGICNFCIAYENNSIRSKNKNFTNRNLKKIINKIKTENHKNKYDCILGISGGVDSSYLAIKCSEWGLRTLLVQFDNNWNTETASKNIEIIQKKTKFDLITEVVNWEEFKDLQLSFLKAGLVNVEAPSDHGIFATMYNVAVRENIKYLFTGVNKSTEYYFSDSSNLNNRYCFGYLYADLFHIESVHKLFGYKKLITFPKLSIYKKIYLDFFKIKRIEPLNFFNYVKEKAIKELIKKVNWKPYISKHFESVITRFHQSYILPVKFKIDKRLLHYSMLIWSNQLTRYAAISLLRKKICDDKILIQDYYFFLKKMNLSKNQFKNLIFKKNNIFTDYPNQYKIIALFKKVRDFFIF